MTHLSGERRRQPRCEKAVGMHCTPVSGQWHRIVTLRNFSGQGFYFECGGAIAPGSLVVLRSLGVTDAPLPPGAGALPLYTTDETDPAACLTYRSHTLARVHRCVRLEDRSSGPLFGIGAQVEILAEG